MQGVIGKQELLDSKHMRCLDIDDTPGGWLAHQRHLLLLTIGIDGEQQFVFIITPRDNSGVALLCGSEEFVLGDDYLQNMLDIAWGKLRSPQGITRVCLKNERSVSIKGPLRHDVPLCSRTPRGYGELHEDVAWVLKVGDGTARWNGIPADHQHKEDKEDHEPLYEGQYC